MAEQRTALFVRLPRHQVAALDRLADASGRHKQHVLSELLADRLTSTNPPMAMGRIEVTQAPDPRGDEVLTLEEAARLLKLPADALRRCAEAGELPGRRFGDAWRFARTALLAWLGTGEPLKRKRGSAAT